MNNVNCSIVEDLLPLYMDGCCSKDSQQAVAEHMKTCEKCRETYRHLQSDLPAIAKGTTDMRSEEIARSLSKRIKKRKAAAAVFAVIFFVFAMLSLFFVGKAIMIMRGQGSQVSLGSIESAVNLSEGDFSCSAALIFSGHGLSRAQWFSTPRLSLPIFCMARRCVFSEYDRMTV